MFSFLKQSTASQSRLVGPFVDDTDFTTLETGLTIANTDVKLSKSGAAGVNKNSGGGTHRNNGMYSLTFNATDTNTVGELAGSIAVSGALVVVFKLWVLEEAIYDSLFGAAAAGFNSSQQVGVGSIAANAITATAIASNAITAAKIAADAIGASELAADAVTEIQSGLATAAALATVDGVVDAILLDTAEVGTAGAGLTAVPWNAAWDAEVQSEVQDAIEANHLDHLLATTYDPASQPGASDALLNELIENDGGISRYTANALEEAPSGGGGGLSLSDFFNTDSGETYGTAVSGSVVKEIADNVALASRGAIEVTDIVIDDGSNPLEGAEVWISTDSAGNNIVWLGVTNASGAPKDTLDSNPYLDAGTYYLWAQLSGYSFSNPTSKVVS